MRPLVSIAMATYNGVAFVQDQIESILAQDYQPLELIICDDDSRDNTRAILSRYADHPRVTLHFNETNLGYIKNFEKALSLCTGEYIGLADQDDIWQEHKISTLVDLARSHDANLVYSDALLIDANGKEIGNSLKKASGINHVTEDYRAFYYYNCVTGCTALFHRRTVDIALPFPEGIIVHDWWLAFVAARSGTLVCSREKLVQYRIHANNQIGIKPVSGLEILKNVVQHLLAPRKILQANQEQLAWTETSLNYFNACSTFEQNQQLDRSSTHNIIGYTRSSSTRKRLFFFIRHRAYFKIIPGRLVYIMIFLRALSNSAIRGIYHGVRLFRFALILTAVILLTRLIP